MSKASTKSATGNFFEDFKLGQEFRHATPRTLTEADAALNVGLYGSRFAINSSDVFARALGLPRAPLDDMLVFHVVIAKTVPDISFNAVANLGYAEFRWGVPVYPGVSDQTSAPPYKTPAQARATMKNWRMQCGITGGWLWIFDQIAGTRQVQQYAKAITKGVGGGEP